MIASQDRTSIKPSSKTLCVNNREKKTSSFFSLSLGILKGNRDQQNIQRHKSSSIEFKTYISQMADPRCIFFVFSRVRLFLKCQFPSQWEPLAIMSVLHSAKGFVFKKQKECKYAGQLVSITILHSTGIYSKENTAFCLPLRKFLSQCQRFLTVV